MFGIVEDRKSNYHAKLFIVAQEVVVIGSEPMFERPLLFHLNINIFTSNYSYLIFLRMDPYLMT